MKTTKPTLKRAGIFALYFASALVAVALGSASRALYTTHSVTIIAIGISGVFVLILLSFTIFELAFVPGYEHEAFRGVIAGLIIGVMLALIW
jgi:hypothetical protein